MTSLPANLSADLLSDLRREYRRLTRAQRAKAFVAVVYRAERTEVSAEVARATRAGEGVYLPFVSVCGTSASVAGAEKVLTNAAGPGCAVAIISANLLR